MLRLHRCFIAEDFDLTLEASAERTRAKDFLEDKVGKGYFDKYLKVRDRLKDSDYKDFNKLIKQDPEEVKIVIDRASGDEAIVASSEGVIGENADFIVYRVTDFEKSRELGVNTRWCITGRYGDMRRDDDSYFRSYLNTHNLDGGYYFYISKHDPYEKFCVLLKRNGVVDSIWKAPNGQISADTLSGLNFPDIKGIDLSGYDYPNDDPDGDPPFTEEEEEDNGFSEQAVFNAIDNDDVSALEHQFDYLDGDNYDEYYNEDISLSSLFDRAIDKESYACAQYIAERDYDRNSSYGNTNEIELDGYIKSKNWNAVDILLEKDYDLDDDVYIFDEFLDKATEEEFKTFVEFSNGSDNIDLNSIRSSSSEDSNLIVFYLDKLAYSSWKYDSSLLDTLLDAIDISSDNTLYEAVDTESDYDIVKKLLHHNADINYEDTENSWTALDNAIWHYYDYDDRPEVDEGGSKRHNLKKIIKALHQLNAEMLSYDESDIEDILGSHANERDIDSGVEYIVNSITNMEKKQKSVKDLEKFISGLDKKEYSKACLQLLQTISNESYINVLLHGIENTTIEKPISLYLLPKKIKTYVPVGEIIKYIYDNGLSDKVLLPLSLVSHILGDFHLEKLLSVGKLVMSNLSYYGKLIEDANTDDVALLRSLYMCIWDSVMEDNNFKYLEDIEKLNKDMYSLYFVSLVSSALEDNNLHKIRELLTEAKSHGILDIYAEIKQNPSVFTLLVNKCYASAMKSSDWKSDKDIEDLLVYAVKSDMNHSKISEKIEKYKSNIDSEIPSISHCSKYIVNLLSSLINQPLIESKKIYFYL